DAQADARPRRVGAAVVRAGPAACRGPRDGPGLRGHQPLVPGHVLLPVHPVRDLHLLNAPGRNGGEGRTGGDRSGPALAAKAAATTARSRPAEAVRLAPRPA